LRQLSHVEKKPCVNPHDILGKPLVLCHKELATYLHEPFNADWDVSTKAHPRASGSYTARIANTKWW
jgi:hypothetical protein